MSKVVLDASAIFALLNNEPGADRLTDELMSRSVVSTVNLAEVQTKLVHEGGDANTIWRHIVALLPEVVPFTAEHARIAGNLVAQTRPHGLSLGDRACLALAITLKAPVYTADKAWKKLRPGIPVHLIR